MNATVAEYLTDDVVTASPTMTLKQVDQLLLRNAISGMPVLDDGRLVGVISQSDIVRTLYDEQVKAQQVADFHQSPFPIPIPALEALARDSRHIADHMINLTVADVMSGVPVTVAPDAPVTTAAELMIGERIHRLLVTDDGALVGVISALDLLSALVDGAR